MIINKSPAAMTSKERVLCTFDFEKTDRVPLDYSSNPIIHKRLAAKLCLPPDGKEFLDALGVDFKGFWPEYYGPALFPDLPGRKTDFVYGFYTKWIEHQTGGYWDFCDFPLKDAPDEIIASFPVPSPDDFDYDPVIDSMSEYGDHAVYIGGPGIADVINSTGRVMGMEQILINLAVSDKATLEYIDRKCAMEIGIIERLLSRASDRIDFFWMGEDLGTQNAPMISLDLYRKALRPIHERYMDIANAYELPVMMHSCGSSSWVFEDYIEMGIKCVDTLQPEALNMSPAFLTSHYSGRLAFHGGISTAGALAFGSVDDVMEDVRATLAAFMKDGGYMLAPTHFIQDNTPVENIIAMYQAAHKYGGYHNY